MRRRTEYSFTLLEGTVPMLIAIGAVLSVITLFFPQVRWLNGVSAVLLIGALAGALALLRHRRRQPDQTALERERDTFLSDVAHELKTPLTVVRGTAEALSDGVVPADETDLYYARILRETDAMTRLVSDLLDVTRLRTGRIPFAPRDVDLTVLAQGVVDGIRALAERKGVALDLECEPLPVVLLDHDRIRQLLVILLDNALKHTPEGGTVTLSLSREGKTILLRVRDTGCGIPAEDLPYLFERFYRADPDESGIPGTGIGLSLARQIVLLHEGTVDVTSEIGKGTCFTVGIPLRECEETL